MVWKEPVLLCLWIPLIAGEIHPATPHFWRRHGLKVTTGKLGLCNPSLLKETSPSYRRRQWHPTPVLLPGKSHGWRGWAAVHGVARSRTRLSDCIFTFHFHTLEKEMQPTPVFLPGESQGQVPDGLPSMGSHRVGHDWSDLAAAAAVLAIPTYLKRVKNFCLMVFS